MNNLTKYCAKYFIGKTTPLTVFNSKRLLNYSPIIMEKAMENLEKNPYYGKYAAKISVIQQITPEEFLKRIDKAEGSKRQDSKESGFTKIPSKSKTPLPSNAYAFAPQKKLESVMKMELLKDKSPVEIKYIWTEYFKHKDAVSGVMDSSLYDKIQEQAIKYRAMLFPVPRDEGYEFVLAQFAAHEIHFTPLINYQAYNENAPECLTMVHYSELSNEKGIVLMHGEFDKNMLNSQEAQFLANEVTLYYGGSDSEKLVLLQQFHESPHTFKHMDLINQLEKLDLSVLPRKKA